jgi:hypothetical protein
MLKKNGKTIMLVKTIVLTISYKEKEARRKKNEIVISVLVCVE